MNPLQALQGFGSSLLQKISDSLGSANYSFDYRPQAQQQPGFIGTPNDIKVTYGSKLAQQIPQQVPPAYAAEPPAQPADPNFRFAFENYPQDLKAAAINGRGPFQSQQPPQNIANLFRKYFPNEATAAAAVASNENAGYNPTVKDNINPDNGSRDRGIFQINEGTFNGFRDRNPEALKRLGVNSFDDLYDPEKNVAVARLIQQGAKAYTPQTNPNGWGGWYGWQDNGFNFNNGWYSKDNRGKYEAAKKGK